MINMGDYGDIVDYTTIEWITFITATIVNPIVMLNLLIAVIGDTYDRV
jgi:hypothetical protein